MAERRIIGSDNSSTRGILGQARQETQNTYGILSQALSQQAEISKSITSDAIAANQAQAEASRTVFQAAQIKGEQVQNEIASVAKTLGNMLGVEQERAKKALELEYKRQEAELKKRQGLSRVGATTEVEELINQSRDILYNDPAGEDKYKAVLLSTLDKYTDLEPEHRAALTQRAYTSLNDIKKEQFQKQTAFFDDVQKAQRQAKIKYFDLQTASVISGIENAATTGSDVAPYLTKFNELLGAALGDESLDSLGRLQLASSALERLANSSGIYEDKRNEIKATLTGVQAVYLKAQQVYQETGGDVNLTKAAAITEAAKYGIDAGTATSFTNPLANLSAIEEYERLSGNIDKLREEKVVTAAMQLDFNTKSTAYLALSLYGQVGTVEALKKDPVKSRILAPVFPVIEAIERYNKEKNTIYADILKTQEEINKWRQQGTQYLNNQLAESKYQQNIINYWSSQYNLPTPPAPISSQPPGEQQQKLIDEWRRYHELVDKNLTDQLANKTRQLEELAAPLKTMGILDATGKFIDPKIYQADYENWKKQVDQLSAAQQNTTSPGVGGRPPNFNQGSAASVPFARVTSTLGQQIPIPFRAGTKNLVPGHGFGAAGDRRHGRSRPHAGFDISAPEGTPVVSIVSGEVVNTNKELPDADGYGNYIDIKDSATGRIHRFAHLQSYSVKKGDTIQLGQEVAKVGMTGRTTGAHLHWETRTSSGGYFNNALDVEREALNLTDASGIKKVRQDNVEWYANAPDPYSTALQQIDDTIKTRTIPGNAVPLNGGSYIVDNKVSNVRAQGIVKDLDVMVNPSNPIKVSTSNTTSTRVGNKTPQGTYREDSYGYAPLSRKSVAFRRKIHEVADRLGIEAVWLIDLIGSVENTNFDPKTRNQFGCTGLIQWCPRSSRDRRSWNENGVTMDQLYNMTDVEQAEQIYEYLKGVKGRLKSGAHLAGFVLFGEDGLKRVERGQLTGRTDGNGTDLAKYLKMMSKFGRNYVTPQGDRRLRAAAVIHDGFNEGCTMCNSLAASNSMIVPHEGQGIG